jgi:hypothetical protein
LANDAYVGDFPSSMEKVMKMEEGLMDENEDVIASFRFLDMDENKYNVYANFVSCFLYFSSFFLFKFDFCVHQN